MIVLPPPSNEVVQAVYSSVGVDEKQVKESVQKLREWLELQPHLPHVMDDKRLENIFLRCKGSIEVSKSTIDMYYTLRAAVPELFSNRDPTKPWFKNLVNNYCSLTMPQLTKENYRISVFHVIDKEGKYNFLDNIKLVFMCHEILLAEDCSAGMVVVINAKDVSLPLVTQLTPALLQKGMTCLLKGFKCRLKAFHLLNLPSYAFPVVKLFKTMLKPKLANRVFVHQPGYQTLHSYISPKILPKEYGGEAEPILEVWDAWKEKFLSWRDWFQQEEGYKADELRRPGKPLTHGDLFGIEGSFRQLSVD